MKPDCLTYYLTDLTSASLKHKDSNYCLSNLYQLKKQKQ